MLNGRTYDLSCAAVSEDAVLAEVFGAGRFEQREVVVHPILDYPPTQILAVSLDSGWCSEEDTGEFTSPWSFAFTSSAQNVLDAVCEHGVLSPAQRAVNEC